MKKRENTPVLTIVDLLWVPVDVKRTEFESGMVAGLTKFTHFISADVAVIRKIYQNRSSLVQVFERRLRPDRWTATPRSKNSSRSNESCANQPVSSSGYDTREVSTTTRLVSGLPDLQRPVDASGKNIRPSTSASGIAAIVPFVSRTLCEIGPPLNRNTLSRSQEHDAQCEIMRCCILQNFARSNNAGDYRLRMYIE